MSCETRASSPATLLGMTDISDLPSDEASTLRLLCSGRKAADVAELLALNVEDVRRRALSGADAMAPKEAAALAESERSRILAVLFGEAVEDPLLSTSPAAQAYAETLQHKLALNLIETKPNLGDVSAAEAAPQASRKTAKADPVITQQGAPNRKRGRLLLAVGGLLAVVVIAGTVISSNGGDNRPAGSGPKSPSTQSAAGGWTVRNRFTLKAVDGSAAKALAGVETKGEASALLIAGNGLNAKTTVGIWLTGGGSSGLIGFQNVNAKGQFSAVGPFPKNLQTADTIVVTLETVRQGQPVPKTPGPVILSSPFSLS